MSIQPHTIAELVGIIGMSSVAVGIGMARHREGLVALGIGIGLICCSVALGGFS